MAEEQYQEDYYLADINTRLSDIEGRNNAMKDRTVILGKNIIKIKEKADSEIDLLKKEISEMKKILKELSKNVSNLLDDTKKNIKRDEMALIERMLKDFQPLEFMREKDVIELIEQKINKPNKTTILKKEVK